MKNFQPRKLTLFNILTLTIFTVNKSLPDNSKPGQFPSEKLPTWKVLNIDNYHPSKFPSWTTTTLYFSQPGKFPRREIPNLNNSALSQVRICRRPTNFAPIFMKDVRSAESNEKSIFDFWDFYFLSYGRLYLQFTKNLPTKK